MNLSIPNPSSRLRLAASAEQADLERHRQRLKDERAQLVTELRRLDDVLRSVDHRLHVLAQLIEVPGSGADGALARRRPPEAPDGSHPPKTREAEQRATLRGPVIREVAVQVLLDQPEQNEALHYRRWYELVQQAGYTVAGKDPLAVFLTQVSRSPVVHKSTKPGVYELDRQAPLRIRQRLERLQAELRDVTLASQAPVDLATVRARRHDLDLSISQQERALEEAVRVLREADPRLTPVSALSGE